MSLIEHILGYCAWHKGWFDRETGKPVECDHKPVSHSVCPACSAAEVAKYKSNRPADADISRKVFV